MIQDNRNMYHAYSDLTTSTIISIIMIDNDRSR